MPYDDADPDDPMTLVGVEVEASAETWSEMAWSFAEEFARLGFSEERILSLFRRPFYAGAFQAGRRLGEEELRRIVAEAVAVWGRVRVVDREMGSLRVLPHVEEGGHE